jgi:hypothetical protein
MESLIDMVSFAVVSVSKQAGEKVRRLLLEQRWNNSIVTATSSSERADATDRTFKVRPEPVEGVTYNGPIEARHGKNLPHNLERAKDDDAPGEEPLSGPDCLRDNDSITKEQQ